MFSKLETTVDDIKDVLEKLLDEVRNLRQRVEDLESGEGSKGEKSDDLDGPF